MSREVVIAIITAVMRVFVIVFTGVLLPLLKEWISDRTSYSKWNRVKEYAYTVVWAAEQIYNKADHIDPTGALRRQYAHEAVERMGLTLGLALSEKEIDAMIECAVHELNGCRIPAVNEIAAPDKESMDEDMDS